MTAFIRRVFTFTAQSGAEEGKQTTHFFCRCPCFSQMALLINTVEPLYYHVVILLAFCVAGKSPL